jgi:hypothetical protein
MNASAVSLTLEDGWHVVRNSNGVYLVVSSWFTTDPLSVIKTFPIAEATIPFNPMTVYSDGRLDQVEQNSNAARLRAESYLNELINA